MTALVPAAIGTVSNLATNPFIQKAILATNVLSAAGGALRRGRKVYKSFRKTAALIPYKRQGTFKKTMPAAKRRRTGKKMPPTIRQAKSKARVRRSRNKSWKRYSKKKSRYRSKLRGLVGPQCLPKTAFCPLKFKIAGIWQPTTAATKQNNFFLWRTSLSALAGARPDPFEIVAASFIDNVNDFSTPKVLDYLGELFDRYRVSWVKHSVKVTKNPVNGLVNTSPVCEGVAPRTFNEATGLATVPAYTDVSDMFLDPKADFRIYDRNWEDQASAQPAAQGAQPKHFKKFAKIPTLMGISGKEYWTEDEYAGVISGLPGARVWADPAKFMNFEWIMHKLDHTAFPAAVPFYYYYTGTITLGTYFSVPNQRWRVADT